MIVFGGGIFGKWLGYEGGNLMSKMDALIKETSEKSRTFHQVTPQRKNSCVWTEQWALTRPHLPGLWAWAQPPEPGETIFRWLWSHPGCGNFVTWSKRERSLTGLGIQRLVFLKNMEEVVVFQLFHTILGFFFF